MIILCEQCQAKFKLDDSKVTAKGVKVRCTKCKHVFTVKLEQPEEEPFDFGSSLEQTPVMQQEQEETSFTIPAPPQPEAQEPSESFSFGSDFPEEAADSPVSMEASRFETAVSDSPFATSGNDELTMSTREGDDGFAVGQNQAPSTPGEVDFDSFDFGDSEASTETIVAAPSPDLGDRTVIQPAPHPIPETKEAVQGLDFSDDDMFGAVIAPPAEEPTESISFDFGTDSFADSLDMGNAESGQKNSSLALDSGADAPFSLGEIDFGDELTSVAVQQVNPDELKPSQEILFAPLAEAQEKPEMGSDDDDLRKAFLADAGQAGQEELPPLSISSRRKQSPLFTGLIAAAALLVVGGLAYFGFTSFSDDKATIAHEEGKISVRAVKASYVKNASAGPLLVISGEAVNEYHDPRAALQVKGMIFDAKGQILASKSAFGGNLLTDEQLATLPLDKIETAMANQFGDSLANMEVASGKTVSFMIVIAKPPKEGKDFGVEPSGSMAAAGKKQQ